MGTIELWVEKGKGGSLQVDVFEMPADLSRQLLAIAVETGGEVSLEISFHSNARAHQ